ncbi:hypothetical protein NUW54_g7411 [Trametes sanguinea]|uniref:Uncharacterized protein n=1 Tax=Trametes sanguinea TaxID=158606 RepID=A0ACC1PMV2_9APHY|nr:hypothetical protein NUW54_g7411 [Trametes sanguinea]
MSASTTAKSASAKGKKAATPAPASRRCARTAQRAVCIRAGREHCRRGGLRGFCAPRPGADVIGGGEYTEEVAYQASRLVRETMGFATGVEGEVVDAEVPWTHPIYRQAFAQVQAELAAEREDAEDTREPALVGEVEAEVAEVDELAEEAPPVSQTRAKRKVAPRPIRVPENKPAAKVMVSKPKRALPADEPAAAPTPSKKARTELLVFPEPVWRPA